jgi:glycosyltransferase involved in cell wall biosynthesis
MNPLIASVVIPTRNRPQAVERCLDALAEQTLPSGSFEVIVVDDGSEPALALDPARWASNFDLKLIHQKNTGPAGARNRGAAEARGEFLAFTDDDCLPTPTWLEKLIDALRENPEAMVGGSTYNGLKDDLFAETSQLVLEMVYEHFNRDPANAYFFASNNMACRTGRYLASGGFDPDFVSPAAEDREFCDRWRVQKRPLVWEKSALLEHRHPQSLMEFCWIYWRYGQGAFFYKDKRKGRDSGTMSEDFRFHRTWPAMFFDRAARYSLWVRIMVSANLAIWQFANASGFLAALLRTRIKK